MSYPCHYTNLCPHKPHKHAHTHTHTHTTHTPHTHTHHTLSAVNRLKQIKRVNGLRLIMINHKCKILGFTCKCVEIKKLQTKFKETEPFTPPPGMRHNYKTPYNSFIIIIYKKNSAIISLSTDNKAFTKPQCFNPSIHLPNYYQKNL